MSGIVAFDPLEFKEIYPQFADLNDIQLNHYFLQAEQYCNNTASSPVKNLERRKLMLYLLVCHIATLAKRGEQTGAIASAGEGSVNVSFAPIDDKSGQWYNQTQCGASYWQLALSYRVGGLYFVPRCKK